MVYAPSKALFMLWKKKDTSDISVRTEEFIIFSSPSKLHLIPSQAPYCAEQFFDTSVEISSGSSKDRGQIFVKLNAKHKDIQQEITATTKDNLLPGQR